MSTVTTTPNNVSVTICLCFSASPSVLSLTATHHLVEGVITMPTTQNDIKVTIRSLLETDKEPTIIGPLTLEKESTPPQSPGETMETLKKIFILYFFINLW